MPARHPQRTGAAVEAETSQQEERRMTSDQVTKDRQIYDDYVRFCGNIQDALKSVVRRSQVVLSLSIATLVGYFAISDRSLMDTSVLELVGLGVFLLGTLPFVRVALRIETYDEIRLKWSLRYATVEYTTRAALVSILELAESLSALRDRRERLYGISLYVWCSSLLVGIFLVALGIILGS